MVNEVGPTGICIVDKPAGWTSHDVVGKARRLLGTRRVGHAGTLDPMATGVLVLGVGRATKLLTFITGVDKTYEARIVLGSDTNTLDAEGEVVASFEMAAPSIDEIRSAALNLTGPIEQIPPMVSAIKVDGTRLHELARQGIEIERAARPVTVRRFDLRPTGDPMVWDATVECSSGTYVRVLAQDLGHLLGGGGHLGGLRRTMVGPFALEEAHDIEHLHLLPAVEAVRHLPKLVVDEQVARRVSVGQVLEQEMLGVAGPGPWAVINESGELLAVYGDHKGSTAKPSFVFAAV